MKIKTILVIGMAVLFGVTSLAGGVSEVLANETSASPTSFDTQSFQTGDQSLISVHIGTVEAGTLDRLPGRTVADKTLLKQQEIANMPAFTWVLGSSPTAAAIIAAYYDRNKYSNIYMGGTNAAVMPLSDSVWPTWTDGDAFFPNNPLVASHIGIDGRTAKGTIEDYWIATESTDVDPFITGGWSQHTWATAIGDYMKTSQSEYGNDDGYTSFYFYNAEISMPCEDMEYLYNLSGKLLSTVDGTYGRKLFYQKRGYTVTMCFNQLTENQVTGGFTFDEYKLLIDQGQPVFINLEGLSVVGYGYGDGTSLFIRDVQDSDPTAEYTMEWGGEYQGMAMHSVGIVTLGPANIPNPVKPAGTITNRKPAYTWSKITGATKYRLRVYKVGVSGTVFPPVIKSASACAPGVNCSMTPANTLVPGKYKWQVQAMIGGVWKPYSDYKNFTVK